MGGRARIEAFDKPYPTKNYYRYVSILLLCDNLCIITHLCVGLTRIEKYGIFQGKGKFCYEHISGPLLGETLLSITSLVVCVTFRFTSTGKLRPSFWHG